jgi:hypothetical protein
LSGGYVAFRWSSGDADWFWSSRWHIVDGPAGLVALPHDEAIKLIMAPDWPGVIFHVTFANEIEAEGMIASINEYTRRRGTP